MPRSHSSTVECWDWPPGGWFQSSLTCHLGLPLAEHPDGMASVGMSSPLSNMGLQFHFFFSSSAWSSSPCQTELGGTLAQPPLSYSGTPTLLCTLFCHTFQLVRFKQSWLITCGLKPSRVVALSSSPALPVASCVSFDDSLLYFELQFSHLSKGDHNSCFSW